MFASSLWILFPSPCRALVKSLWTGSHMTLEGDLKDTLQSVKKKEEHPFCDFVINIGVNVCQSTAGVLLLISINFLHQSLASDTFISALYINL